MLLVNWVVDCDHQGVETKLLYEPACSLHAKDGQPTLLISGFVQSTTIDTGWEQDRSKTKSTCLEGKYFLVEHPDTADKKVDQRCLGSIKLHQLAWTTFATTRPQMGSRPSTMSPLEPSNQAVLGHAHRISEIETESWPAVANAETLREPMRIVTL